MGKRGRTHVELDGLVIDKDAGDSEPLAPVTLGTIDRDFSRKDRKCWGCVVGFEKPDREGVMHKLWNTFENFKGKLHDLDLCELIAQLHRDTVVIPMQAQGEHDVLEWPMDMVYTHIHHHMVVPKYEVMDSIKKLKTIMSSLEDCLFEQGADGKCQPNHANIKSYATIRSVHHKYITTKTE